MDDLLGKLGVPGAIAALVWAVVGGWQLKNLVVEWLKERNGNGTGNGHSVARALEAVRTAVDDLGHAMERELDELRKGVDADNRDALETLAGRIETDRLRAENERLKEESRTKRA